MFDVIGDTFYLSAKQAGGKNPAENRKVQEKLEVVRFIVPLGEWKNKRVKV